MEDLFRFKLSISCNAIVPCVVTLVLSTLVFADDAKPSAAEVEFFEKSVRPILVARCYECHASDERNGGLALDSRAGWAKGGDSGPAVIPGKPDASLLVKAIRYSDEDLKMPPKNRLSDQEIATLTKWVDMGAPDPRADSLSAGTGPTGMSIADGRRFWSFKPIDRPAVPVVKKRDWIRTPIDAFILAQLEAKGFLPAPGADKRTLIRRATFDLTGLPPTPAEVNEFVRDDSPEAFQKVITRLLNSPQYGIRWGRHWLDVARYADSNGLDENLALGQAWRYRDYVIRSFNNDKPYDRFLIEQIAGDLIPGASIESKTATGFLVLGAKVLAEPDMDKLVMDTIDEQLDTTGKVFMGLTIGCVRCHDHKFDPLKQKDYYALAAIFKSTRTFAETRTGVIKHWHEYSLATPKDLEGLKVVNAEIGKRNGAASSFKSKAVARIRSKARQQAAEYLAASTQFSTSASLTKVTDVAKPLGLHPRILHHCRLHLEYHKDDPFFSKWHEIVDCGNADKVAEHFRELFKQAETQWTALRKKDPKATKLSNPQLELARKALNDPSGFLAIPPKPEFALDAATLKEYYRLMEKARVYESAAPDEPSVMGVADGSVLTRLPIHIRGSYRNLGEPVAREFPEVFWRSDARPIFPANHSGRLEFARWMASSTHPLTSRVYVNRLWRWHFGQGLVKTTENFGRLGDRPSHPQLLDWLARRFVEMGWSTKAMHRLIMSSSVYQMASLHPDGKKIAIADPENRLLWRFNLHRLEAEQIRDAILAVSGRLDDRVGGKTVPLRNRQFVFNHTSVDHTKYDSLRRAVYLPVIRNNIYPFFEQFDFPDPTMPTGSRASTVVAPQALLLLNSKLVMESADAFANLVCSKSLDAFERVELAYAMALGRPPTDKESQRAIRFVASVAGKGGSGEGSAWSLLCQSLFASNEFIYLR